MWAIYFAGHFHYLIGLLLFLFCFRTIVNYVLSRRNNRGVRRLLRVLAIEIEQMAKENGFDTTQLDLKNVRLLLQCTKSGLQIEINSLEDDLIRIYSHYGARDESGQRIDRYFDLVVPAKREQLVIGLQRAFDCCPKASSYSDPNS